MVIEILFIITLFFWLLAILPLPPLAPYAATHPFFAFTAVLLLGLYIFLPGLRG